MNLKVELRKYWTDFTTSGLNITNEQAASRLDDKFYLVNKITFINTLSFIVALVLVVLLAFSFTSTFFDQITTLTRLIILFIVISNIIVLRITKNPIYSTYFVLISYSLIWLYTVYTQSMTPTFVFSIPIFICISFALAGKNIALIWNFILILASLTLVNITYTFSGLPIPKAIIPDFILILVSLITIQYIFFGFSERNEMQLREGKRELAESFNSLVTEIDQRKKLETQMESVLKESAISNLKLRKTQKAMINIMEDLENEKASLLKQKAKDDAILKSMGDALIVTDKNGIITLVNDAFTKTLKFNEKSVIGKKYGEVFNVYDETINLVHENDLLVYKSLREGQSFYDIQRYYEDNDKNLVPVNINISPIILDEKIVGTVAAFRDITQQLLVDKAKTEFVSLASHQLKTPLSAINWFSELLLDPKNDLTNE